jgi:hypothetical protein
MARLLPKVQVINPIRGQYARIQRTDNVFKHNINCTCLASTFVGLVLGYIVLLDLSKKKMRILSLMDLSLRGRNEVESVEGVISDVDKPLFHTGEILEDPESEAKAVERQPNIAFNVPKKHVQTMRLFRCD